MRKQQFGFMSFIIWTFRLYELSPPEFFLLLFLLEDNNVTFPSPLQLSQDFTSKKMFIRLNNYNPLQISYFSVHFIIENIQLIPFLPY